jgi:hypothetical protein
MASSHATWTYRVRQIPANVTQSSDAVRLLQDALKYQKVIVVYSLASSVDSIDYPPTKTATVTFEDQPQVFNDRGKTQWVLPKHLTGLPHNLIIDTHFHGFTTLNEVGLNQHILE